MSANPASITSNYGLAVIEGKIAHKRRIQTQTGPLHLTILRLRAADEFETAPSVEVRSTEALGDIGSTVKLKVRVGGRQRTYKNAEDETVRTADVNLTVVS